MIIVHYKNEHDYFSQDEYGEIQCRTQIMDTIQATLECCGANGPEDWAGSKYSQDSSQSRFTFGVSNSNNMFKIPKSCCKDATSTACNEGRQMKIAGVVSSAIYSEVMLIFIFCHIN